jgi:hypothetical protein
VRCRIRIVSWRFKGKTPPWANILATVIVVNTVLLLATSFAIPRWSPVQRDNVHSYPIHFRGGPTFFVQPWLGAYSDYGYYAGFGFLALFFLLLWLYRDRLERIP